VRHFEGGFGLSFTDLVTHRPDGHENSSSNLSD